MEWLQLVSTEVEASVSPIDWGQGLSDKGVPIQSPKGLSRDQVMALKVIKR